MNSIFRRVDLRVIVIAVLGLYLCAVLGLSKFLDLPLMLSAFSVVALGLVGFGSLILWFGIQKPTHHVSNDEITLGKIISSGSWGEKIFGIRLSQVGHVLITGLTGSGKSTLIRRFIQGCLRVRAQYLYIDFKGDQSDHEELLLINEAEGLESPIIFDISNPKECVPCNFLTLLEGVTETVEVVTDLLIENDTPSYFRNEASRFLKYSLQLLDGAGEVRTFVRVEDLFQDARYRAELLRRAKLSARDVASCVKYFEQEFNVLKPEARSERLSGIISSISKFTEGDLRRVFNSEEKNQLEFSQIFETERSAILRVPSEVYGDLSRKIVEAFLRVFPVLVSRRRLRCEQAPYVLFLDEACSYLSRDLVDLGKKCRSANIKMVVTRMCDADFQAVDRALLGQFLSLFSLYICMQTHDPDTRETMARLAMTEEDVKFTRKVALVGETGEGSERDVQRFRYHPTEFGRLERGHAIVISPLLKIFEKIQIFPPEVAA